MLKKRRNREATSKRKGKRVRPKTPKLFRRRRQFLENFPFVNLVGRFPGNEGVRRRKHDKTRRSNVPIAARWFVVRFLTIASENLFDIEIDPSRRSIVCGSNYFRSVVRTARYTHIRHITSRRSNLRENVLNSKPLVDSCWLTNIFRFYSLNRWTWRNDDIRLP